jgi:hypothetical protein
MKTIISKTLRTISGAAQRSVKCVALIICICLMLSAIALPVDAAIYTTSFESLACNSTLTDGRSYDGAVWDIYFENPLNPLPTVGCTTPVPNGYGGSKYIQWTNGANQHDNGTEIILNHSVVMGSTYYLATYVKFIKTGSADIWVDTGASPYSFDKLIEFAGSGIRWGIGAGWMGEYPTGGDGKFTFDVWCTDSINPLCYSSGIGGSDHKVPNQSGYSRNNPYRADYSKWYSVVIGITAHPTSGRFRLWVNGTPVSDYSGLNTANSGAVITRIYLNGTIAQPAYTSGAHIRQFDRILLTTSYDEVLSGGFMTNPESSAVKPSAPVALP